MLARLKQEQELCPQSAASLSSSSWSSSSSSLCSISGSSSRPSKPALSPLSPSRPSLCSPSLPHCLRHPAMDVPEALQVRAEFLKFPHCQQPLKALQICAEFSSPSAWLLTSPEPLYFLIIHEPTCVSSCIILFLANKADSAPVIDRQFSKHTSNQ